MRAERRHRVVYSYREIVAALKAHRPTCLVTQAIPDAEETRSAVGLAKRLATIGVEAGQVDIVWHAPEHIVEKEA